jgi:hypothetical protein
MGLARAARRYGHPRGCAERAEPNRLERGTIGIRSFEDHAPELPAGWSIVSARAGGGGLFLALGGPPSGAAAVLTRRGGRRMIPSPGNSLRFAPQIELPQVNER